MTRWLIVGLIALVAVIGLGAYFGDGKDWGPDREAQVITTDGGETIVIERDRGSFPFPFLFIPFLAIGLFWFLGSRRRGNGSGPWGSNQDWLRDWHEREHREMASRMEPPPA